MGRATSSQFGGPRRRIKSKLFLAAAATTTTFCVSRGSAQTVYSLSSTFTAGTWSNTGIWNPSGIPGPADSISQGNLSAAATVTLDPAGDAINNLTYNASTNLALSFVSSSSSPSTLTVENLITKTGTSGALNFGSNTNPVTIAGSVGGYTSITYAGGTNLTNNTVNIYNTNTLNNVSFSGQGNLRSDSTYTNNTSTTVTIGSLSIAGNNAVLRMLQTGGGGTLTSANFTVGDLNGTLGAFNDIEIDASNSGSLALGDTFTIQGSAAGLAVTSGGSLVFGTGVNGSNGQYKFATLLLSSANALATTTARVPVYLGNGASLTSSTSASYVGLNLVSSGANAYNNPVNIAGFSSSGPLTQTYTIGAQNSLGTTATFSGPVTIGSGTIISNLQVSAAYSGATLALTGNIAQATVGYNQALTIVGAGVVLLSGSNTYAGGTTVNNGATLLVNNTAGSGTGAGSVNVAGVLAGTGTISGAVNSTAATATIQPGTASSIGTFHAGALSLADSSTFAVDINSGSVTSGVVASSELISSGAVSLGTTSFANLSLTDLGSTALPSGDTFTIITSTAPITTIFHNLAEGALIAVGANTFDVSYMGDKVTFTSMSATPEPGTLSILAIVAVPMLARRRRTVDIGGADRKGRS